MIVSQYRRNRINELQNKAYNLYKEGTLTTRQVAAMIGMSNTWVWRAVKAVEQRQKLSTVKIDKEKQKADNK